MTTVYRRYADDGSEIEGERPAVELYGVIGGPVPQAVIGSGDGFTTEPIWRYSPLATRPEVEPRRWTQRDRRALRPGGPVSGEGD